MYSQNQNQEQSYAINDEEPTKEPKKEKSGKPDKT